MGWLGFIKSVQLKEMCGLNFIKLHHEKCRKCKVSFICIQYSFYAPSAKGIKKATSFFYFFLLCCFSVVFLGEGLNGQLAVAIDRCRSGPVPGSGRWVPLSLCWIIRFKH